jgi:hypothetical protein
MITWVIQISLISIIFIFLVHHLFCYLKNILTIPKVKDLVTLPSKKYENILSIISNQTINNNSILKDINTNTNNNDINNDINNNISYTEIDLLPNNININSISNSKSNINDLNNVSMKDELKSFFKSQLNDKDKDINNIDFFNNYSSEENYSYL